MKKRVSEELIVSLKEMFPVINPKRSGQNMQGNHKLLTR